ncbi:hypothetical protein [Aquimarina aggregata]|uniref:hypothetical protein n=1 Tax=Aquimarina aggregata TaxID=1642818 RepID=UPI0024939BBC|nr:hypothetical protein [Aquimarina aggregata]
MNIIRGLKPAISEFNDLEQKLIKTVAKKLEKEGLFPDQITEVKIIDEIHKESDYHKFNGVTFFINPYIGDVGGQGFFYETTIEWNRFNNSEILSPTIKIVDNKVKRQFRGDRELKMKPIKEQEKKLKEVNKVFILGMSATEKIDGAPPYIDDLLEYYTSKSLYELVENHFIIISDVKETANTYRVMILRKERAYVYPKNRGNITYRKGLILEINVETSRITKWSPDSYDPLYTPATVPEKVSSKNIKRRRNFLLD